MNEEHVRWCKDLFGSMALGGMWGVPRSGLIFRKTAIEPPTLELSAVMPHQEGMPLSPEELINYQEDDFAMIRAHFGEAGIKVEGEVMV